jgi:hypothetical protein
LKKKFTFLFLIWLLLNSSVQVVRAQATKVTLYDGIYTNNYLSPSFSFNNNALGNIGNLTISNRVDHKLNVTLIGLEGFVVVSAQNRTITAILGVIIEVKNGAVSYTPTKWVILDEMGGERDTVTLLVYGYCIGPYDVDPGTGSLDVLMPTQVDTIDSFSDTREIVDYSNGLNYPSDWPELDKVMARSVFFFALTNQDVTPEKLQQIYPNRNIGAIVSFVIDSLKDEGINTEGISMLTYGLGKEDETPDTTSPMIPGFPFSTMVLSIALLSLLLYSTRNYETRSS